MTAANNAISHCGTLTVKHTRNTIIIRIAVGAYLKIFFSRVINNIISSPEPKAHGELIVYQLIRRLSVCL